MSIITFDYNCHSKLIIFFLSQIGLILVWQNLAVYLNSGIDLSVLILRLFVWQYWNRKYDLQKKKNHFFYINTPTKFNMKIFVDISPNRWEVSVWKFLNVTKFQNILVILKVLTDNFITLLYYSLVWLLHLLIIQLKLLLSPEFM